MLSPTVRKQQQQLVLDYLSYACKGARVDPLGAAIALNERYGIRVDWHEVSAVLENMIRHECAVYDGWGHDAQRCYIVC